MRNKINSVLLEDSNSVIAKEPVLVDFIAEGIAYFIEGYQLLSYSKIMLSDYRFYAADANLEEYFAKNFDS